jgi:hypothetical protein
MNANDLDRRLADWLGDGPTVAPEPSIAAALGHARSHPRRPDLLAFLRRDPMGARAGTGSGMRVLPVVVALGILLVAALAVASAGGWLDQRPAVVPPATAPVTAPPATGEPSATAESPIPSATPSASPVAPGPTPVVVSVELVSSSGRALSTIEVVDESSTLVGARTGRPGEDPSDPSPSVRNDPGDPATVVLTWYGILDDLDRRLTIAADGRTMTLDVLPGCGDLLPVNRVLVLTFSGPVPADEVAITVVPEPRTCE